MKSTYRCPGCERTFECRPDQLARLLERGQTACKFCGGELEFPEGLREALASAEPLAGVAWDYTRVSQIYLPRAERLPAWREHTLDRLRGRSWFFGDAVKFAELTLTPESTPEPTPETTPKC